MIGSCIEAITSQTAHNFEIIIISDGSTDETDRVVKSYNDSRILFFEKENGGQASARNLGITKSKGKYISLCDDDDRFYQDHLITLSNFLDSHEDIGLVYSDCLWDYENSGRKSEVKYSQDFDKKSLENFNYITPLNIMFRKSCLEQVDLFNEAPELKGLEDWEFFLRLSDYYPFFHLKKITSEYRVHEENSFQSKSGYDYNRAFYHLRTQRFQYLITKFGHSLFDHVDHMYPFHLVQCCLNNGKFQKGLKMANKLYESYKIYSQMTNKAPFTEVVIFFSLGISSFAAGYETEANNFFKIIVDHPSYTLIKEQFDEFIIQYVNRTSNMGLKTLLDNCFLSGPGYSPIDK